MIIFIALSLFLAHVYEYEKEKPMQRVLSLLSQYTIEKEKLATSTDNKIINLQDQITLVQNLLEDLRINIRSTRFKGKAEEIRFFKEIKPQLYADFIFFRYQLKYLLFRPTCTKAEGKRYIKNELKKLNQKRKKQGKFYSYMKMGSTHKDELYFLRESKQLQLFEVDLTAALDPEFYTSHDSLAAAFYAFHLLSDFYKQELQKLNKRKSPGITIPSNKNLNWSASKTDLVELIYALKISGSINSGNVKTKDLINAFSTVFGVDLNNHYKTLGEIKNRSKKRTKFLEQLTHSMEYKLDYEDGL